MPHLNNPHGGWQHDQTHAGVMRSVARRRKRKKRRKRKRRIMAS